MKGARFAGALCVLALATTGVAVSVRGAASSDSRALLARTLPGSDDAHWRVLSQSRDELRIQVDIPRAVAERFVERACSGSEPAGLESGEKVDEARVAALVAVPEPRRASIEVEGSVATSMDASNDCAQLAAAAGLSDGARVAYRTGNALASGVGLDDVGWLRDQPLARLRIDPVVRDRAGSLTRVEQVHLRIEYGATGGTPRSPDPSFRLAMDRMLVGGSVPASAAAIEAHRSELRRQSEDGSASPSADPEALRVVVESDGMVAVTGAQLEAAGWSLTDLDPARFALESGGTSRALDVSDLGAPGFDSADRLLFHGRAMTGPYTRENVYWLSVSEAGTGMVARDVIPVEASPPAEPFTTTVHFEEDTALRYEAPAAEGPDRWMWSAGIVAPDERTEVLSVTNRVSGPARVRVALQAGSQTAASPDHHVRLWLNEFMFADESFDGLGVHMVESEVPLGVLVEGDNSLRIELPGDTDADIDRVYLNWVDIEYWAGFRAHSNRLAFSCRADGRRTFDLWGFTSPDIAVYDVTDPVSPVVLRGVGARSAAGEYTATFEDDCGGGSHWEAVASGAEFAPVRIERNSASDLRSPSNGADYVIVVHEALEAGVSELVESQIAAGRRVAVVRITDIYDEFSYGVFDPRAIRSFLRYTAASWVSPAPAYVMLVGEANLDYRRGYDQGPQNFVPSMEIDLLFGGQATSDVWFAALDDDDTLPDVMLGRISATTSAQVSTAISKILRFQSVGVGDDWRRRAVMVADDDGAADLEYTSERLISLLPPDVTTRRFYAGSYPRDQDLTADIQSAINAGAFILNFTGHGNVDLWSPWPGGGQIFNNNAISGLTNGDMLPIFTAATCMNGWFAHPLSPTSMSELWLRHPNGGGVAAWSPTGIAPSIGQEALLFPFYTGLFDGRGQSLGGLVLESVLAAYPQSGRWRDVIQMFVFMGDPSTVAVGASVRPTPTPVPNPPAFLPALPQGPASRP